MSPAFNNYKYNQSHAWKKNTDHSD